MSYALCRDVRCHGNTFLKLLSTRLTRNSLK